MDQFWGKIVVWDDGVGQAALEVPNHLILQIWDIQSSPPNFISQFHQLDQKSRIWIGELFCMAGGDYRIKYIPCHILSRFFHWNHPHHCLFPLLFDVAHSQS